MSQRDQQLIIVGMSGGVDSAVAAMLLLKQGYRVEGLFMKNWEEDDTEGFCAAEQDLRDAQIVCQQLKIPLHKVNFSHEYWERVFQHFLNEYQSGRTPNPDILCNKEIKFKAFLDHAMELGAQRIATGHYARILYDNNEWTLGQAIDTNKDQTYFLYTLGQRELSHSLFPLGEFKKAQVRKLAYKAGFPNHCKKDSTGICFIGERRFRDFLRRFLLARPGDIMTSDREVLGQHQGLMYYTMGQRQGLGIGGRHDTSGAAWYVADKDIAHNTLIVAQGHEHPLLYHNVLHAEQLHWVQGNSPDLPLQCSAKIRYRHATQECRIDDYKSGTVRVIFSQPQRAITPGQAVVFYDKDICLGGGTVIKRERCIHSDN
jgi:tRNA-specific 2-thiouridylase